MIKMSLSVRKKIIQDMIIMFFVVMIVIVAVCMPQIHTELSNEMFQTGKITVYADGYYGRTMEQPLELTKPEQVQDIVEAALRFEQYELVTEEERPEGMNGIWIDFHTGYKIGMYADEDYGNVGEEMNTAGPGQEYRLPPELRKTVIRVLEENSDY